MVLQIDYNSLAYQILSAVRIISDANSAAPGKEVHFDIVPPNVLTPQATPGSSPTQTVISPVQGLIPGLVGVPIGNSTFTQILNSLPKPVELKVSYSINQKSSASSHGGTHMSIEDLKHLSASSSSSQTSHSLNFSILFMPPIIEDVSTDIVFHYNVTIYISVILNGAEYPQDSDGNASPLSVTIPVDMPSLKFPAILVVTDNNTSIRDFKDSTKPENYYAYKAVVMLRRSSIYKQDTLQPLINELNRVMITLDQLKSIFGVLGDFNEAVSIVANLLSWVPEIYVVNGNTKDLGNQNMDDDPQSLVFIAPSGSAVSFFADTDFEGDFDNAHAWNIIAEEVRGQILPATGIGMKILDHIQSKMGGGSESIRWGRVQNGKSL